MTGETGIGKELVARALLARSRVAVGRRQEARAAWRAGLTRPRQRRRPKGRLVQPRLAPHENAHDRTQALTDSRPTVGPCTLWSVARALVRSWTPPWSTPAPSRPRSQRTSRTSLGNRHLLNRTRLHSGADKHCRSRQRTSCSSCRHQRSARPCCCNCKEVSGRLKTAQRASFVVLSICRMTAS
jgi:hypothetical protein